MDGAALEFASQPLTGGPWRSDAQHGGPPSALLGFVVESAMPDNHAVARISIELVKPVPLERLTASVRVQQTSRRVTHISADLAREDGAVVAQAAALVLAQTDLPTPAWEPTVANHPVPGPQANVVPPSWATEAAVAFHRDAVDHRFESGAFTGPGPADDWVRLRQPVVDAIEPSPLCRVLAAADLGSGISAVYEPSAGFGMINADLTIALHRPLEGEWCRLQSTTRIGPGHGHGLTTISDESGPIGIASQSLIGLKVGP